MQVGTRSQGKVNTMGYVQTLAATLTKRAADALEAAAESTPDERLTWQPMGHGRSILEQLVECALANQQWAGILTQRAYACLPADVAMDAARALDTRDTAIACLRETTAALVAAILAVDDAEIGRVLAVPPEDGVDLTLAEGCLYAYWNMVHHDGQIRYIQTLYGDMQEPPAAPADGKKGGRDAQP